MASDVRSVVASLSGDVKASMLPAILKLWSESTRDVIKDKLDAGVGHRSQMSDATDCSPIKIYGNSGEVTVGIFTERIQLDYGDGFFNQYMSLDGSTSYKGKSIGWWVTSWYEYGVEARSDATYMGNQPISAIGMVQAGYNYAIDHAAEIVSKVGKNVNVEVSY